MQANRDLDLVVAAGSIHGIVGENGAGKSTLMSILSGFHRADSGTILIDGRAAAIGDSRDAYRHGIGMVYQHFMLVDRFSVLENVMLGAEGGALLGRSAGRARAELARLGAAYGLTVDPDAVVETLPLGQRQRVEILRALYRGARILILDEPTSVLTPQEADDLFRVLRALRDQGSTVLLVTHKLREIMAVTDAVSVMRGGGMVAARRTAETSVAELGELMIGRRLASPDAAGVRAGDVRAGDVRAGGAVVLEARGLQVRDAGGVERLRGVDLTLRAGEIVAVAGVAGNGQGELLEALAGMVRPSAGTITLRQRPVFPASQSDGTRFDAAGMRAMGVAHVPEDRLRDALLPGASAAETAILGHERDPAYRGRFGLLSPARISGHGARLMRDYDVRPADPLLRAGQFSGGNQQKLVIGREIERLPAVLLVGQPTRGVDIGGIDAIHARLRAAREGGMAILLVSVELDEIMALADRILVMSDGRIVGALAAGEASEARLGPMMAGMAA